MDSYVANISERRRTSTKRPRSFVWFVELPVIRPVHQKILDHKRRHDVHEMISTSTEDIPKTTVEDGVAAWSEVIRSQFPRSSSLRWKRRRTCAPRAEEGFRTSAIGVAC